MQRTIAARMAACGLLLAIALAGCNWPWLRPDDRQPPVQHAPPGSPASGAPRGLQVVATIYPLAWFAEQVAGELADVTLLVPGGADPHTWEPTAATVRSLAEADVFIYNSAALEPWAERLLKAAGRTDIRTVAAGESLTGSGAVAQELADGHNHESDPHVWLDPVLAQQQVKVIAAALAAADPDGAATYEQNADAVHRQLAQLDAEFAALTACPERTIVMATPYFTHPAHRYGLQQLAATESGGHDAELRPGMLARLVSDMRRLGLRYVFAETADDRTAQTLARETGAAVLVLHPLERLTAAERQAGLDYMAMMRQNLANLRIGLGCDRTGE